MSLEQEIKLVFESAEAARRAVITAGGRLVVSRRLLVDALFDTPEQRLRAARCALRVRRDGDRGLLTFKGPVLPGPVKSREEIETAVGSADVAEALVRALGFQRWFVAEKYREEYRLGAAGIMIDETPIGVFVEIEASAVAIDDAARLLGRTPADYRVESYARLYFDWCAANGVAFRDMTFSASV
jgi:adenylate cyclase class 2